jgi:hypothetical protein
MKIKIQYKALELSRAVDDEKAWKIREMESIFK